MISEIEKKQNEENDLMKIDEKRYILDNFKTIFYTLNARPDSTTKVFQENVIINIDDIFDLKDRVIEKIKNHYKDDGIIITIDINMNKGKILSFSNWAEFEQHKWNENNIIKSITMKIDFNIFLTQYEFPQRHTLVVKLSSGLKTSEIINIIFSGNIEDINEIEINASTIVARIDYVNTNISDELLNIVSDWVKALNNVNYYNNKIILFLRKYRKQTAYFINYFISYLIIIIGMLCINNIILSNHNEYIKDMKINEFMSLINGFITICVVCFTITKISGMFATKVYKMLEDYGLTFTFYITKGDKKEQEKLKELNEKNKSKIIKSIILTIFLNVICGIIVAILTT